jgi:uncharacterized ion transporter superfamily protein YfcC
MEQKSGAQISRKAFLQSFFILLALMILAGVLTRLIQAGSYNRTMVSGREIIDSGSYHLTTQPVFPIWGWFTAPVAVLGSPDGTVIIVIILFILMVGVSFALLDHSGIIQAGISRIVRRFENQKYTLLLVIIFFFMLMGAFFGLFEEVVPLIPVMVGLAYLFGWDALVGLGMSILATNMGFSAAISNPFTIGLAQKLAGLPLLSGFWLRIPIFIVVYIIFAYFLTTYARKIERNPETSPVFTEDSISRQHFRQVNINDPEENSYRVNRAIAWFGSSIALILIVFLLSPFVPFISEYSLPLVGLLFLIAGVGASLLAGVPAKGALKAAWEGVTGIAPGIPLILMAASIKYIIATGGILDTVLHGIASNLSGEGTFLTAYTVYGLALFLEFFVASASAKAFLMMPILFPLGDLVGLTRQTIVLAYCFGDGFTNMIYPTNAVLLISLGLASVSYGKWLKWSLKLWIWIIPVTLIFLAAAVALHFGPF